MTPMPNNFDREETIKYIWSLNLKLVLGYVYSTFEGATGADVYLIWFTYLGDGDFRFSMNKEELVALAVLHGYGEDQW